MINITRSAALLLVIACIGACSSDELPPNAAPTAARAATADDWPRHGRNDEEQRFSSLDDINADNVDELGLAWYFDVPTNRGMEATPIVVDGTMYVTGSWSIVYALDAATGKELWRYDPQVPKAWAQYACCDVVNRGVAVDGGLVFVGTLDGYLVAVDRKTGEERWRTDTIDRTPPYTITGAPRIVDGLVYIGNGGADLGARGYISAYYAGSGELRWRFYTVPGNPADGFESEVLEKAAETWNGEWWKFGGGGTVWDSMAYDAELGLLYFGVGNGSPWNQQIRSPGGGDNLFLSSIIAVNAKTGEYVWHYQTTPGETWDFTATQHMILADLDVGGTTRKVLMQAPKNGFFYVLDRTNGKLLSAEAFANITWATGVDMETGRPIENPAARYLDAPALVMPSGFGAHNWHPMAYSPRTRLVYLPAQSLPGIYATEAEFNFDPGYWNPGIEYEALESPDDPATIAEIGKLISGELLAWDPVAQKEVWRYQHAGPWNGGVMATAGDLVFQGSLIGEFAAYDAESGKRLWVFDAQTGVAAAPVSYRVDGEQHVAVAAGWGTIFALMGGNATESMKMRNKSRILAFKLGGEESLPARQPIAADPMPEPPARVGDAAVVATGKDLYYERCVMCHGIDAASGGLTPDLRRTLAATEATWHAVVLGGAFQNNGMPAFGGIIGKDQSDAIRAFVISEAWRAYDRESATADP